MSAADRRRILSGLSPAARRVAVQLLDEFCGWDPATLQALRAYAISCARLEALQTDATVTDTRPLHREIRHNLALLKALDLPGAR